MNGRRWTLVLGALVGCSGRPAPHAQPALASEAPAPADAAVATDGGPPEEAAAPPRRGPHAAAISATVLDRTATAAVSIDTRGAARLWPALDGSREPVALPVRGAGALDLARSDDGFVVGAIDASGAPRLYRLDADGGLRGGSDLPAAPQAIGLVALTADAWLVVRADQTVELYDRAGHRHGAADRDRTRVEALRAIGPDTAVALVSEPASGQVRYGLVTLTVVDDALRWGAPVELEVPPITPVELAVTPDGRHVGYLAARLVVPDLPAAAVDPQPPPRRTPSGRAARPRRPLPRVVVAQPPLGVVIVDRTTGVRVRPVAAPPPAAPAGMDTPRRLGFVDDATALACDARGTCWQVAVDSNAIPTRSTVDLTGVPAIGPGIIVGGSAMTLRVSTPSGPPGYLGYGATTLDGAALSPDGARVAWLHGGQLTVEPVGGGGPTVTGASEASGFVGFVDDSRLLVAGPDQAALLDAGTLAAVATQPLEPWQPPALWNPRTGWLAGRRLPHGAWTARVTAAAIAPPRTVDDGARGLWLLDATDDDAPALLTWGADLRARVYGGRALAAGIDAVAAAAAPTVAVAHDVVAVEPSGAALHYDGRLRRGATLASTDLIELGEVARPRQIASVPGGGLVMLAEPALALALDRGDAPGWAVAIGPRPQALTLSADGRRALAVTLGGATIIDVATGAVVDQRCGWGFGRWPARPDAQPATAQLVCD
ncbi:MAG: hypothetical protein R3B06_01390 [Kofleriaceae bacterium]